LASTFKNPKMLVSSLLTHGITTKTFEEYPSILGKNLNTL
jgi:hypothetical protein